MEPPRLLRQLPKYLELDMIRDMSIRDAAWLEMAVDHGEYQARGPEGGWLKNRGRDGRGRQEEREADARGWRARRTQPQL